MLKILKQWIVKIFSDLHSAIISFIVVGALAYGIGFLFELLQFPIPLWLTILLVLSSIALTYAITARLKNPSTSSPYKIQFIDVGDYRWKVKVFDRDYFEVDKTPLCIKHDLPFVSSKAGYCCPDVIKNRCDYVLPSSDFTRVYEEAKSYIDKTIRDTA